MILISHRGNIDGPNVDNENKPSYIANTIDKGYDCEVDFWYTDNKFTLGHDNPQYEIPIEFIQTYYNRLWIHCKNYDALSKLIEIDRGGVYLNYFWHESDDVIITSKGYMWANPGVYIEGSIAVLPELKNDNLTDRLGVCSDYIINYEH
jgi:hypothetical protein